MAVMKKTLLAATVLTSSVLAAPFAGLDARALVVQTVTETDWTTVDVTATVWVNDADPTAEPYTAPLVTPTFVETSTSSTSVAAPSTPTPSAAAPAVVASSSSATAPAVSPAGFAAEPATTTAAYVPSTFTTSTAPLSTTSGLITQKSNSASTSGTCEGTSNACVGDVTHWDGGLGACGWNVNTDSDLEIALPFAFMGTQSNGNPYCGRSVTLLNPTSGTTVKATVGDKCMGCVDRAIDLTNALFNQIVPGGDGRVSGIQWWFD